MNEEIIKIDNVEICIESFGNFKNFVVFLIMGVMFLLDWWDEDFCFCFVEYERFVICYDYCDLGWFIIYLFGMFNYIIMDMVDDVIGILDVYFIDKVYIVGMFLGGMIG